jgi:hypothetical protein
MKDICTFVDNLAAAVAFPTFYHRKEKTSHYRNVPIQSEHARRWNIL